MKHKLIIQLLGMILILGLFVPSCSLEEEILDELTEEVVTSDPALLPNLLAPPLGQLRGLWLRENVWGLQETTSDECMFPTRGTDWRDNGVWEQNYFHTWRPNQRDVNATWDALNTGISSANTALFNLGEESADDGEFLWVYRAQAKFLRAFYEYMLLDLYGTYPVRDPFNLDFSIAPDIMNRTEGFYRLVSLMKQILPDMKLREADAETPDYKIGKYGEPTRDAGLMMLAKLYLNKEVYTGISGWDSCMIYLDELIESGNYGLAQDYYAMFDVDNNTRYKQADDEAIFVAVLDDGDNYGLDNRVVWVQPHFHYNQTFGGTRTAADTWNGGCVTEDYLNDVWVNGTDTSWGGDVRWRDDRHYDAMGVYVGFNYGQQYDAISGDSLFDRSGNPLYFTFECPFEDATEYNGVRALKYPPREDPVNVQRTPNDFIIWRYADALLMKAECLVRKGNAADALTIVNDIRSIRNAPELGSLELMDILDERGRELYWEGHRRQDQIRFGTFLDPKSNKPEASPETAKLLPIPQDAIDGMPGGVLVQNPGY
ncbi:MAG: RagB/SusD family nutrient uptake outer membrane protein [Bacteroidales bacterium]|nr:RagB/SusD family nutrient uptake outer membrane protein [Bacteroidales bacterium]